jgi:hypothetical protein
MATLTYPGEYPANGREVKRHLDCFVKRALRYWGPWGDDGPEPKSIFWFLEFQQRGAPHFHLFLNFSIPWQVVAQWWFEIVGSGDDRHLQAGTRIEALHHGRYGTIGYAAKYAAKAEQKEIPPNFLKCGRFWGIYGDRRCLAASIFFPVDFLKSEVYIDFRFELTLLLKTNHKKIGRLWQRGFTSGANIKQQDLCEEIKLLFLRYSMKLVTTSHRFDLYEHPTLGIPMETVHELPATVRRL